MRSPCIVLFAFVALACGAETVDVKQTDTFRRIKSHLDRVPAIDTHDHLKPFALLQGSVRTEQGTGMTLYSLWKSSYYTWINPLTDWPASGRFDDWWPKAKNDFANARATSFYRYQLPAFTDLYGVDFEDITEEQARDLNRRIYANYQKEAWIYEVVTERANIELMFNDPYWDRLARTKFILFHGGYPWVARPAPSCIGMAGTCGSIRCGCRRSATPWPSAPIRNGWKSYPATTSCGVPTPIMSSASTVPPSSRDAAWPRPSPRKCNAANCGRPTRFASANKSCAIMRSSCFRN